MALNSIQEQLKKETDEREKERQEQDERRIGEWQQVGCEDDQKECVQNGSKVEKTKSDSNTSAKPLDINDLGPLVVKIVQKEAIKSREQSEIKMVEKSQTEKSQQSRR